MTHLPGRMAIYRLIHIANHSPTLASSALQIAIPLILESSNTALYINTIQDYNALPSTTDPIHLDHGWIEEISSKNSIEKNRLEFELKQYTSNMIKESIRVSSLNRYLIETYNSTFQDGTSRFGRLLSLIG